MRIYSIDKINITFHVFFSRRDATRPFSAFLIAKCRGENAQTFIASNGLNTIIRKNISYVETAYKRRRKCS